MKITLQLSPRAEEALVIVKKLGIINDKDVSNKQKQLNIAAELLCSAINSKALTIENCNYLLKKKTK
jgi:hypothetical protein